MCFPTYGLNLAIGLRIGLGLKKKGLRCELGPYNFYLSSSLGLGSGKGLHRVRKTRRQNRRGTIRHDGPYFDNLDGGK